MATFDIELVGKVGSMALINSEFEDIDYNILARLSRELKPGFIWVTSGAVEIGRLDFIKRNGHELCGTEEENKTDYASQGQSILMSIYRQYIDSRYSVRQILVEHQHFNDIEKRKHLFELLNRCPKNNAIPIINYNDAVSYEENRKMEIQKVREHKKHAVECVDNDETASQIACLVKCKTLLILTTVDGIYANLNDSNTLIEKVGGKDLYELLDNINQLQEHCKGASRKGAQGARAKLEYIKEPVKNGTEVIISNSRYSIADILSGKARSTRIGLY